MRVLLSDGSGLTARQCATLLARAGHEVGVLVPEGLALTAMTGSVRRRHRVPVFGPDPLAWADAMLEVLDTGHYDVLLPTQEQVAVLSLLGAEITARGVGTAVPTFAALCRVFDKLAAEELLTELGLPRPPATVARTPDELLGAVLPAYLKAPVATASTGVRYVESGDGIPAAAEIMRELDAYRLGGVLVQAPVPGPLLMVQAVFDSGRLLAAHANRRDRTGSGGGASHKTGVPVDPVRPALEQIGTRLGWHGALSCDVIDGPDGPVVIDVNPRLVDPAPAGAARRGAEPPAPAARGAARAGLGRHPLRGLPRHPGGAHATGRRPEGRRLAGGAERAAAGRAGRGRPAGRRLGRELRAHPGGLEPAARRPAGRPAAVLIGVPGGGSARDAGPASSVGAQPIRSGSDRGPRTCPAAHFTAPGSARSNSGMRCIQTSSAIRSSIRARCEPMQRWMPRPNAACRLTSRSMTTSPARSKCSGSRLAAGKLSSTQSSAFMSTPCQCMSCLTRRAIVTGA